MGFERFERRQRCSSVLGFQFTGLSLWGPFHFVVNSPNKIVYYHFYFSSNQLTYFSQDVSTIKPNHNHHLQLFSTFGAPLSSLPQSWCDNLISTRSHPHYSILPTSSCCLSIIIIISIQRENLKSKMSHPV